MADQTNGSTDGGCGGSGDIESNEKTTLLQNTGASPVGSGSVASDRSDTNLWREMDMPWPATFERSISLLASPVIKAEEAQRYTKSPKPGNTPLANRRRMVSYNRLDVAVVVSSIHCSHGFSFHESSAEAKLQMAVCYRR
jgi:hypothetical protein